MFEHHRQPLLSRRAYFRRLGNSFLLALVVVGGSLFLGIAGYRYLAGLGWLDSLLNASMILAGMGPTSELTNATGKLFASFYALFSGLAVLTTVAILLAPVIHRAMHKFHIKDGD